MPKLKTKSSIKKRFSRTGTGKIKFKPAGKRHGMSKRSNKFVRNTKRSSIMSPGDIIADFFVLRINLLERLLIPCLFPAGLNLILPVPVLENLFFKLLLVLSLGIVNSFVISSPSGCPAGHNKFDWLIMKIIFFAIIRGYFAT